MPIIETVLLSVKTNNTVKSILKLGCYCLISYSRYRKDLSVSVKDSLLCGSSAQGKASRVSLHSNHANCQRFCAFARACRHGRLRHDKFAFLLFLFSPHRKQDPARCERAGSPRRAARGGQLAHQPPRSAANHRELHRSRRPWYSPLVD